MRFAPWAAALILSLTLGAALAEKVNVPTRRPVVTVDIPDAWEPEETDRGVACESPDKVATVFFEIARSEKSMNTLIDDNIDWLVNDQGVRIDTSTKQEKDMVVGGISSSHLFYDAKSKEFGPAKVGFIFTPVGSSLLVTTYWISKKGADRHEGTLSRIFASVRPAR